MGTVYGSTGYVATTTTPSVKLEDTVVISDNAWEDVQTLIRVIEEVILNKVLSTGHRAVDYTRDEEKIELVLDASCDITEDKKNTISAEYRRHLGNGRHVWDCRTNTAGRRRNDGAQHDQLVLIIFPHTPATLTSKKGDSGMTASEKAYAISGATIGIFFLLNIFYIGKAHHRGYQPMI